MEVYPLTDKKAKILWDNSIIGLAFVSKDGHFLKVNQALCSMFEYTVSELEGLTFQEITLPTDVAKNIAESKRLVSKESDHYVMHKSYITKSNRIISCILRVDPAFKEDGTFDHFIYQITKPTQYGISIKTDISKSVDKAKSGGIWEYIKLNTRWLLPVVVAILTGIFGTYKIWIMNQVRLDQLETTTSQILETLRGMDNKPINDIGGLVPSTNIPE